MGDEGDSDLFLRMRLTKSLYGTRVASEDCETDGGFVAEAAKKAEEGQKEGEAAAGPVKDRKPLILGVLVIVNSLALLGVGAGLFMYAQATRQAIKGETEISESAEDKEKDKKDEAGKDEAKMVPLESFIINLNGSEGYKFMKITMSLEVDSAATQDEIVKRQAQVRDTIVVLLTSKSYSEVAGENGQQKLKEELVDTVNSFLVKGKIKKVLFTDFLFN